MDKGLVSIVVPVYNVQKYVQRCLESLAQQSYEDIEIVIVDDGSTDKSGEFCEKFVEIEKRARVYHKKNGGLSDARNYGIKKSNGNFVVFVDSDDYVKEGFVKELFDAVQSNGADIAVCGFNDYSLKQGVLTGEEATKKLLIEQENIDIVAWNKIYRRDLFLKENIWYPFGMKHEDALTTYKLLSKAKKVAYINKSLYHYIERDDSIMAKAKTEDRLKVREIAAEEAVIFFKNNNKELKRAAEVSLLLAKYAFMDAFLHGEIDKKYYNINYDWVKRNLKKYKNNHCLTKKLKLYNFLVQINLYSCFRRIV